MQEKLEQARAGSPCLARRQPPIQGRRVPTVPPRPSRTRGPRGPLLVQARARARDTSFLPVLRYHDLTKVHRYLGRYLSLGGIRLGVREQIRTGSLSLGGELEEQEEEQDREIANEMRIWDSTTTTRRTILYNSCILPPLRERGQARWQRLVLGGGAAQPRPRRPSYLGVSCN